MEICPYFRNVERSNTAMKFGAIEDLLREFLRFLDRVMGWLNYVIGGADSPYEYEKFWESLLPNSGE